MARGVPHKKYTSGFKKLVAETMQEERSGYRETAARFGVRHRQVQGWERISLTEEPGGCFIERRGRRSKELTKEAEEDLLAEVQRFSARADTQILRGNYAKN